MIQFKAKKALNKTRQRRNGPPQSSKGFPPFKSKFDSFVTGLDTVPKPPSSHGTGSSNQNVSARRCPLCEKSHDLEDCGCLQEQFRGTKEVLLIGKSALLCLLQQKSSFEELHKKENMQEMQKATPHSTPYRRLLP